MTDSPIISAFITVIVALLCLGGLSIFLKKLGNITGNSVSNKLVKVVSKTYIAPKHYLVSVLVGNKILVLGVADSSINVVTEISHPDEVRAFLQEIPANSTTELSSLPKIISHFIGSRKP